MSFFKSLLQIGVAVLAGFLGPGGFSWGQAAIGNLIGGLLFNRPPKSVTSPGDLQQPQSNYDEFIKILFGTVQVAAHIVDGDPKGCIIEEKKTYSIGRYFSGMLLWCEAVHSPKTLKGLKANGELIYNADGATDAEKGFILTVDGTTGVASGPHHTGSQYFLRHYPGNNVQPPDPDLEAVHGVGKVPAHRQCCCTYLKGWPLEATDYALPKFEAILEDEVTGKVEIVELLTGRAGVPDDVPEFSEMSGDVPGFFITAQGGADEPIEAIANYDFCDIIEVNGRLKDSSRKNPTIHEIDVSELGAHEFNSDMPPLLQGKGTPNYKLPQKVGVRFIDSENNYEENSAGALRQTGNKYGSAEDEKSYTLQIVDTYPNMVKWAQPALDEAWAARDSYELYLPSSRLKVAPGDVLRISGPQGTIDIRVTAQNMGLLGAIRCEGNTWDASVYTGHRTVVTTPVKPAPTIPTYPTPLYVKLDTVALRESDENSTGWYIAVGTKYGQPWDGANLECGAYGVLPPYVKKKGGGLEIRDRATIGTGTIAGASWGGNTSTFDTASTLTVDMAGGETPTTSTDADVLKGANEIVFGSESGGWEVLRFVNASFVQDNVDGTKRYTLTRLLRGQRGTLAKANSHSAGDTVVVNNNALVRVPLPST